MRWFIVMFALSALRIGVTAEELCIGESKPVPLDSRLGVLPLVTSINLPWNAEWIGDDKSATIIVSDNGKEVKRATGTGAFTYEPSGVGHHLLTYATEIDGVMLDGGYSVEFYMEGNPTSSEVICSGESASTVVDARTDVMRFATSIELPWDASWIGGEKLATVVISDNGVEVHRTSMIGTFTYTPAKSGHHLLTYITEVDGVTLDGGYVVDVYSSRDVASSKTVCVGESRPIEVDARKDVVRVVSSIELPWDASWIGGEKLATVVISDNGVEVSRTTESGFFIYAPSESGRHLLTYATEVGGVTQDGGYAVEVYFLAKDLLPDLSEEATPEDVQTTVAAFADAAVAEHLKTVEDYNAFKAWVGEKDLAPQAVAEAPRAWASYVLGQPALLPEGIPEDAVKVESFEPDADTGNGAYVLTFRLEGATLGEEAMAALLETVFDVQGVSSLGGVFSSSAVEATFEVVDGKVRVKVSPKGDTLPGTFFYRIRLK